MEKLTSPGRRRYLKWVEIKEAPVVGPKEGTFDAEFFQLQPESPDVVLIKYDWSAFNRRDNEGRDLETILKEKGITTLVITGVKTDVCVGATVRDAYLRNYFVVVPKEAVNSENKKQHEANLKNFDPFYGDVVGEEEIDKNWFS